MAADAYLFIEGIKGESADSNHSGWIEIISASWGVTQPRSATASTAGGHTAERCEHKSISLGKLTDVASPILMQMCSAGRTNPKVVTPSRQPLPCGAAMKRLLCATGLCALSGALKANGGTDWSEAYKPLNATYLIYSGEPGERAAPTGKDRKIAIAITGNPAKEIFDSLYPDAKDVTCTSEKGERLRRKGDIWCSYRPSDGYKCFLGYNLRNGQPHSGASC